MHSLEAQLRKRIFSLYAAGAILLLALAGVEVSGASSSRTLEFLNLMWCVAMFAFLLPAIRLIERSATEQRNPRIAQGPALESKEECLVKMRSVKHCILFTGASLLVVLWTSRSQDLFSRIAEIVIWLSFLSALIRALIQRQKKVKSL